MKTHQTYKIVIGIFLVFFSFQLKSQNDTSIIKITPHSANKATLYSALLPGAGQVYNKKIWKVPIIYAGFGALGYMFYSNNDGYKIFKNAYALAVDNDPNTYVVKYQGVNPIILKTERDRYRKNRDLSMILAGGWYLINLLDANVDGHLYDFDSQDFSFQVDPIIYQNQANRNSFGLSCKFRF